MALCLRPNARRPQTPESASSWAHSPENHVDKTFLAAGLLGTPHLVTMAHTSHPKYRHCYVGPFPRGSRRSVRAIWIRSACRSLPVLLTHLASPLAIPARFGRHLLPPVSSLPTSSAAVPAAAASAKPQAPLSKAHAGRTAVASREMEYGVASHGALLAAAPLAGQRPRLPLSPPPSPPSIQVGSVLVSVLWCGVCTEMPPLCLWIRRIWRLIRSGK